MDVLLLCVSITYIITNNIKPSEYRLTELIKAEKKHVTEQYVSANPDKTITSNANHLALSKQDLSRV